jgi:pantothenate synthetase
MKRYLLTLGVILALSLAPAQAAKGGKRGGKNGMRSELDAAVRNGNLNEQERQRYDNALKTLDEAHSKRKSGETVDRAATRQAMKDLGEIAKSENLRAEDREKLAKVIKPKGRRSK